MNTSAAVTGRCPTARCASKRNRSPRSNCAGAKPIAGKPGFWQPALQVNYPDADVPFTRIVELKHATGQDIGASTIIREYPVAWTPGDEPYYPVPAPDARAAYQQYADLAAAEPDTSFIGRLASYRYYNMDQVTAMALAEADRLLARFGHRTTRQPP